MNKEMYNNITRIESTYVKKITSWYAHSNKLIRFISSQVPF
jgi:hypothetical protein